MSLLIGIGSAAASLAVFAVCIKWPASTAALFWCVYCLQTTMFDGVIVPGAYYPLYVVMGLNVARRIAPGRERSRPTLRRWWPYITFMALAAAGYFWAPISFGFDPEQRLFIYAFGAIVSLQLWTTRGSALFRETVEWTAVVVAAWTIYRATQSDVAYRGGTGVNPNYVATIIAAGWITMCAKALAGRRPLFPAACILWTRIGIAGYATVLLASRGVLIAMVASFIAAWTVAAWRRETTLGAKQSSFRHKLRMAGILLVGALAIHFLQSTEAWSGLAERLDDSSMATYSDREGLWERGFQHLLEVGPFDALLGGGLGTSERIVREVDPFLTSMHNGFLQFALDFGLVGVSLLAIMLAIGVFRKSAWCAALSVFLIVISLSATASDSFVFWSLYGVVLGPVE